MRKIQEIAQKVLMLLLDILVFSWQGVRRVILPTRSRKGNVLSSLLTFFVGLLERIVSFGKNILKRPVVIFRWPSTQSGIGCWWVTGIRPNW